VNPRELALVQGWSDTRATLAAWNRAPSAVLPAWIGLSGAIAGLLLLSVVVVALLSPPDSTPLLIRGLHTDPAAGDVGTIILRNSLVLALHAMACVAGFIAKSSLPREAESYSGLWRRIHDHAGPAAIAFVAGATLFSLATQSYALGARLSTLAEQLGTSPPALLLALLPHALPELVAIFLPLAAWLIAARAEAWHQLLAATFATTAIAAPVVVVAAIVEVYVTPDVLRALHFV
jgi:Stage II sporulation protein M